MGETCVGQSVRPWHFTKQRMCSVCHFLQGWTWDKPTCQHHSLTTQTLPALLPASQMPAQQMLQGQSMTLVNARQQLSSCHPQPHLETPMQQVAMSPLCHQAPFKLPWLLASWQHKGQHPTTINGLHMHLWTRHRTVALQLLLWSRLQSRWLALG